MTHTVFCIRHGESAANAGAATDDPLRIPLTERGHAQAGQLAHEWNEARPGLIVVSPATRAQQTAAPMCARFPDVPTQTWPVQEFCYLDPVRCAGTTAAQRRAWVEAYWQQADPVHRDGPGAETFAEFMARVQRALQSLATLAARTESAGHDEGPVLLFGHGQFINAMRWLQRGADPWDMQAFRRFDLAQPVHNGEVLKLA